MVCISSFTPARSGQYAIAMAIELFGINRFCDRTDSGVSYRAAPFGVLLCDFPMGWFFIEGGHWNDLNVRRKGNTRIGTRNGW